MLIRELRRRAQRFIAPSFAIFLVAYFLHHLIQGERGMLALRNLEATLEEYHQRLHQLKHAHDLLAHKVHLLKPGSLCPDLLEERAKAVLGYTHKNEQIVLRNELK
jgi:cell division protein FtsB